MKKLMATLAMTGLTLICLACGGSSNDFDCPGLCTKSNACTGATQNDCAVYCAGIDALVRAANCTSQYSEQLTCMTANDSAICQQGASNPCATQVTAFSDCMNGYCAASSTTCGGHPGGNQTITQTQFCDNVQFGGMQQCWAWSATVPAGVDLTNGWTQKCQSNGGSFVNSCATYKSLGTCDLAITSGGYTSAERIYFYNSYGLTAGQAAAYCAGLIGSSGVTSATWTAL